MMETAVEILLIEDNPHDAELTIRALKKNNLANNLLHLRDGQEALDFLFNDKNQMPKVDGIEVLRRLKSDGQKKMIPTVVLTSSKEERDVVDSYKLGVNAYIVKPVDFDQFVKAVTQLGFFWLILNQSPH